MGNVFLALEDKDKNELEKTLKRRHNIISTLEGSDYVLFDPNVLPEWQEMASYEKNTDFVCLNTQNKSSPKEMMEQGVISYFYRPYETRHVMNLFDRISRYKSKDTKKNVLILDDNINFLDECRQNLSGYDIITAMSPEAVYEIAFSNRIDVAVLSDYLFDHQIKEHMPNIMPYTEFVMTEDKPHPKSLQTKIEEAIKNKQYNEKNTEKNPRVHTIMGPRAAGKTTLVNCLEHTLPNMYKVVRAVGREPRPYEIQGEDHLFLRDNEILESDYLTYEHRGGYIVGIPKSSIENGLKEGRDVLLTLAESGYYKEFKRMFPSINPLMVLCRPEDLEQRSERRDIVPETLQESKIDYEKCLEFAKEKDIPVIYNPEPWLNPYASHSATFEEFRAISGMIRQGRELIR